MYISPKSGAAMAATAAALLLSGGLVSAVSALPTPRATAWAPTPAAAKAPARPRRTSVAATNKCKGQGFLEMTKAECDAAARPTRTRRSRSRSKKRSKSINSGGAPPARAVHPEAGRVPLRSEPKRECPTPARNDQPSHVPARLGFGLGLRPQHYTDILEGDPPVDWFEVISENYMVPGGNPLRVLDQISERYPCVMHGVSMSIASTAPFDEDYLDALVALSRRVKPKWISDHLCWTGVHGVNLHDLLPFPYTREALDHVVARIDHVQERIGRPLCLENVSTYVSFNESEMTEWEFIAEMTRRTGCWLLFDVNNVFVPHYNHGTDARTFSTGFLRTASSSSISPATPTWGRTSSTRTTRRYARKCGTLPGRAEAIRSGLDHDRAGRQHPTARRTRR